MVMSSPAPLKCNSGLRFVAQSVVPNKQHNKTLHPTAYSSVRSSLRFQRRVSLAFGGCARRFAGDGILFHVFGGAIVNITFHSTEDFEKDLQSFDVATRQKIARHINQVAQEFVEDKKAFARHARKPCSVKLNNGYDSSLYSVKAEPNVRILLTVDDDPIFEQVIITLMRAVKRSQSREAFGSVLETLNQHLNGRKAEEGVLVG